MGAGGDRKVTPGVTGSSRARAPIDPAVWYLGPLGPWGRIVVTRLKYPQKNTSIGLYRRNPTSFIQDVRKDALGRAGEGNAEGSPTGFQHPVRWKINRNQKRHERRSSNNIRQACRQGSLSPTGPHGTRRGSTRSLHSEAQTSLSIPMPDSGIILASSYIHHTTTSPVRCGS